MNISLLSIGKGAAALTAIIVLIASMYQAASFLGIAPVSSMELRKVEKRGISYSLPTLKAQSRSLRITRGQLKQLPQTMDTISDIEAYNDEIADYDDLIISAKRRAKELK